MAEKIVMPQAGQDITEGRVVKWHKAEGDPVDVNEVICEVETEKAVFEVESPIKGVLLKILVPKGKVAPIFSTIGIVGQLNEKIDLEKFLSVEGDIKEDKKDQSVKSVDVAALKKKIADRSKGKKSKVIASGRARKTADQKGIDISKITGSGPNGRITEKDVLSFIEKSDASQEQVSEPQVPIPQAATNIRGTQVPMTKMRQVIARRLQQSKQTIPHFYITVAVDMSDAIQMRTELNSTTEKNNKISLNDFVVKASANALQNNPQVNCKIEDDSIVYLDQINIGIAVSVEEGLLVPVLPDVDTLSLKGISKKIKDISNIAKTGKQATLTPGTFTISNMGMMDVDNFIAIVNPPETAILAVGSVRKKLIVTDQNTIQIRDMMNLTLSADHRAIDGALGSRFINNIKYYLENPKTIVG